MKLLLISNSTNAGEEYLRYPLPEIGRFLQGVREIVFVPYAAVTFSYAEYEKKVQARFSELGIRVRSVHRAKDPARMIREAEAICVGGGNTFALALTVLEKEREERHIFDLAGGGFESTVRLAKSAAATWVPILLRNKYNVLDVLREHIHQLQIMRRMIERDDAEGLTSAFGKANSIQRIIH